MKNPLNACFIAPDLFGVELHGKAYVRGEPVDGRVTTTVDKATLLAMASAIQAALDGFAPSPGMPRRAVLDLNFEPEDLV